MVQQRPMMMPVVAAASVDQMYIGRNLRPTGLTTTGTNTAAHRMAASNPIPMLTATAFR
jgi:hypothetical protein